MRVARFLIFGIAIFSCQLISAQDQTAPPEPAHRVVFIGDSRTAQWPTGGLFQELGGVNAGIGGETTSQIASRFDADTAGAQVVVLNAGTNDVLLSMDPKVALNNIKAMLLSAKRRGVPIALCLLQPIDDQLWDTTQGSTKTDYQRKVRKLNDSLVKLAHKYHAAILDLYTPFINAAGGVRRELYQPDGVHLNGAGYLAIGPATRSLVEHLQQKH